MDAALTRHRGKQLGCDFFAAFFDRIKRIRRGRLIWRHRNRIDLWRRRRVVLCRHRLKKPAKPLCKHYLVRFQRKPTVKKNLPPIEGSRTGSLISNFTGAFASFTLFKRPQLTSTKIPTQYKTSRQHLPVPMPPAPIFDQQSHQA